MIRVNRLGLTKDQKVSALGLRNNFNKINSNNSEHLVLFFRSEDQANGMPKRDKGIKIKEEGLIKFKVLEDTKYTKNFGFDFYREDIFGKNKYIFEDNIKTSNTIEDSYEFDSTGLSLEINNKNNKVFHIDYEFNLVKNSTINSKKYCIPSLLVLKGKTITIYAKYFSPDNNNISAKINLSDNIGIDKYTNTVLFNKSGEIRPISITTSSTVNIVSKITLSVQIIIDGVLTTIGKCNILPNNQVDCKFIFVDLVYNNQTSSLRNCQKIVKEINENALNQAGINILKNSKDFTINLSPQDCLRLDKGETLINTDTISNCINNQNQIINGVSLQNFLKISTYKFYEKLAIELLYNIETELKSYKVTKENNSKTSLFNNEDTIEKKVKLKRDGTDIENQIRYNLLINHIVGFFKEIRLNYFIILTSDLLTAKPEEGTSIGYMNGRSLVITATDLNDSMVIAHEIGHNFNLAHTFNNTTKPNQIYNLEIPMTDTLENIMDYLAGTQRKNFMSFQWSIMQKSLSRYTNNINDIDFKSTIEFNGNIVFKDDPSHYLDKDLSTNLDLKRLSTILISSIFYDIDNIKDEKKEMNNVLNIISLNIQNSLKFL
jgi:hypothetical protein